MEPGVAGDVVLVGEAASVGDAVAGRVGGCTMVALDVASAMDVGAGPPGACKESRMPASTVATETRPIRIPLTS